MKLERDDWALLLRHLDTALDLREAERTAWLDALALDPPRLKEALRQMLADRARIETDDFLAAGARVEHLPAPPTPPGGQLGPWRLLRELGRGGMATVWLARREDGAHQREVALKLPHPWAGSHVVAERFRRERRILSTLQHPHIAQVLDAGEAGGQPWLALEYVEGRQLIEHAVAARLSTPERLRLFLPVLRAVQHAHAQLVIHRDLKPANVMVDAQGMVKLLDFGVAKLLEADPEQADTGLTREGGAALTPQYASPEQAAGLPLGVASDVYSLGVLLFELLTGQRPYTLRRAAMLPLAQALLAAEVRRPSQVAADPIAARALRGDLDTIVLKAMQHEPAQRYASAEALAQDIERHLASQPILARPAGPGLRLRKLWSRRRLPISAAAAVLLALGGGGALALWQARQAQSEAARASAVQAFLLDIFKANSARQPEPEKARAATARELLDLGAERIGADHALAGQPRTRLTLLDTLGELYHDLGLLPQASAQARQAVALALAEYGRVSTQHLRQLARLADVLADAAGSQERGRVIAQGHDLLRELPDRPSAARAEFLIEAATFYVSGRLEDAERDSLLAIEDARALADPHLLRRAWEAAGVTALQRADMPAAETRLSEAVRVGEQAVPEAYGLLRTRVQLADVQARRLHLDASLSTLQAALADTLRVNGPSHLDTLMTRSGLGFALYRQGRLQEADAQYREVQTSLVAAGTAAGLDSFVFPLLAGSHGRVLHALGRLDEAEDLLRRGLEMRDRTRGGTRVAAELREFLVPTLIARGKADEAAALLAEAARIRTATGNKPGQRVWGPHALAAVALARARGDTAGQTSALAGLVAGGPQDPADSLGWIDGTLLRARFEQEHDQADAALNRLRQLRDVLARHGLAGRLRHVEGQRLTLCAALAGQQGASAQASAWLDQAQAAFDPAMAPGAPWLRDLAATREALPPVRPGAVAPDCA